ncbi:MAG TPA: DUF4345 domain-containing protein [Stellaceae bacterium]|nr:DUF4345 domain-containing protein [Stellaceae bacterium]
MALASVTERRLLQIAVVIASLVPLAAGTTGVLLGPAMVHVASAPIAADSHYRYLSGLLLGIGCAFVTTVPRIERHGARFRILTAIVVIGGLGRLLSLALNGYPGGPMLFGLVMELGVTPALALWQRRIAHARSG